MVYEHNENSIAQNYYCQNNNCTITQHNKLLQYETKTIVEVLKLIKT